MTEAGGPKGRATIDSKVAYDVWNDVIADEDLYRAVIAKDFAAIAARRGYDEEQVAVLEALSNEPGTRWNIENLRFRSALEAGVYLASYMPLSIRLLTNGDDNWLQDICFEYLAYYRWQAHGHHRLTECERFGAYVRERILRRRIPPPQIEPVLAFELAVVGVLKKTAGMTATDWPADPVPEPAALAELRPRRPAAQAIVDLPVDIRAWISSGTPSPETLGLDPVTLLVYVPSLSEKHRIKAIGDGARAVLEACDGERTARVIAAELEDELEIPAADIIALLHAFATQRILALS